MKNYNNTFSTKVCEACLIEYCKALKCKEVPIIDLSNYLFFDIGALTYLLAFCSAVKEGKVFTGFTPSFPIVLPIDKEAKQFIFKTKIFTFSSLNEVFVQSNEFSMFENDNSFNNFYPYFPFYRIVFRDNVFNKDEYFENDCQSFVNKIVDVFFDALIKTLGFKNDMADNFWEPNKEIFENIYKHSNSWGFSIIQCFKREIIICYADIGVGVRQTLDSFKVDILKKLPYCREWNDGTAILGSFLPRYTRLPGKSRGLGLYFLENYINTHLGCMEYRSGNAKVVFTPKPGKDQMHHKGFFVEYIPGVQIIIRIPSPIWKHKFSYD